MLIKIGGGGIPDVWATGLMVDLCGDYCGDFGSHWQNQHETTAPGDVLSRLIYVSGFFGQSSPLHYSCLDCYCAKAVTSDHLCHLHISHVQNVNTVWMWVGRRLILQITTFVGEVPDTVYLFREEARRFMESFSSTANMKDALILGNAMWIFISGWVLNSMSRGDFWINTSAVQRLCCKHSKINVNRTAEPLAFYCGKQH